MFSVQLRSPYAGASPCAAFCRRLQLGSYVLSALLAQLLCQRYALGHLQHAALFKDVV